MNLSGQNSPITAKLSVLHLILSAGETSAAYNEHCIAMCRRREISLCTYFRPRVVIPPEIHLFAGDGSLMGFVRALREALRAKKYDVIHAHSPHVALLFLITTSLRDGILATSTVVTVHDSYPDFRLRNKLLLLPSFAQFAHVVCCSRTSFASFPSVYRWLAGQRLEAVQNGVDLARVDRIAAEGYRTRPDGVFSILSIGRLVEIKNPTMVLAAVRDAMDSRTNLTFIGNGPLRRILLSTCSEAGVDRQVTFTGLLPREQVFENMVKADLFISASLGEGLPVAVLEAMACECPVLLSDIPPHREIVGDADFIPLVKAHDKAGFVREIVRFRNMDQMERAAVGHKCRLLVEQRFSLDSMHAGYEAIYRNKPRQRGLSLAMSH